MIDAVVLAMPVRPGDQASGSFIPVIRCDRFDQGVQLALLFFVFLMAGRLIFPTLSLLSLSSLAAAKPQDGFSVISHVSNGGLSASQAGVGIGVDDSQDLQVCWNSPVASITTLTRRLVQCQHHLRWTACGTLISSRNVLC